MCEEFFLNFLSGLSANLLAAIITYILLNK